MKKNNEMSFIIFAGLLVLSVFTFIVAYNLLPRNKESNNYYAKVDEEINAKIESLNIVGTTLNIITSGEAKEYCIKTTKSTPSPSNLCWNKIENNEASISIMKYKKYYLWIKDNNGKISSTVIVNK